MKKIANNVLVIFILIMLAAFLTGCSGCGCSGCCGGCCGDDDASEDEDDDDSSSQEQIPTTLGQTTERTQTENTVPSVCNGITTNSVSATASKSSTGSGYTYSFSYTIRACASTIGYSVVLDGAAPLRVESNSASLGRETTGSDSYSSTQTFTQFCIKTSDMTIGTNGAYCVPLS